MLLEKIKNYNVYLASQSPRRQNLLKQLGVNFNIAVREDVEENYHRSLEKEEIAMYLSDKKSTAYKNLIKDNRVLITADTIVWIEGTVLSKPKNKPDAVKMLNILSGKKHSVITGITLKTTTKHHTFFCLTDVWFKNLSSKEINYYVDNFKPFDKAGAYGIQEWIGLIAVEKIEGSYNNVVGLPIQKLYTELDAFLD
ncbi:MAG: septum formation protein Maf [Bacteroidales bacterium]|nr:septum formation protein Maf [Bacteroidales bacterium]